MTDLESSRYSQQALFFGDLEITFDERVLRPRAWTIEQSKWASELLNELPVGDVLELCAGAGHIGLQAVSGLDRKLVQVDINEVACEYAKLNALAAGIVAEVRHGRIDEVIREDERFTLIIADPPWVQSDTTATYPDDPLVAIDGGKDGLELARTCIGVIDAHLSPDGFALIQLGSQSQLQLLSQELSEHTPQLLQIVEFRTYRSGVVALLHRAS